MRKKIVYVGIADAVILIVYHLIAFLVPFQKTEVFWIAYGFSLGAFVLVTLSVCSAFIKGSDVKSMFYGFPIARIGVYYGFFQLLMGYVFMAWGPVIPWWVAVLVFAIPMGIAILSLIGADTVRNEIDELDEKLAGNVTLMRTLYSQINQSVSMCKDEEAVVKVKMLAEEMRYSDPVSSDFLAEIETDLAIAVNELKEVVLAGDVQKIKASCDKTMSILYERNRLCKLNKE
jgi:hypothetical protein